MAVAPNQRRGPFATKPTDVLVRETEDKGASLKRVVGLGDLTALGLGAIIGTGIFVVIGEAITSSGPSIVLRSCSRGSRARSPRSATPSSRRASRSRAAPTRTRTRRWAS